MQLTPAIAYVGVFCTEKLILADGVSASISNYPAGGFVKLHTDNEQLRNGVIYHSRPKRKLTTIVYLNNCVGGALFFGEKKRYCS